VAPSSALSRIACPALAPCSCEACLERRSQVVALGRLLLCDQVDLLPFALALDQVKHRVAVAVLICGGFEVGRERPDKLAGHPDLLLRGLVHAPLDLELVP